MKAGRTLQELAAELERQNKTMKVFIVEAEALSMSNAGSLPVVPALWRQMERLT